MTIRKGKYGYEAICDNCDESEQYEDTNFYTVVDLLKSARWKFVKDGEVWYHYCDQCRKEI